MSSEAVTQEGGGPAEPAAPTAAGMGAISGGGAEGRGDGSLSGPVPEFLLRTAEEDMGQPLVAATSSASVADPYIRGRSLSPFSSGGSDNESQAERESAPGRTETAGGYMAGGGGPSGRDNSEDGVVGGAVERGEAGWEDAEAGASGGAGADGGVGSNGLPSSGGDGGESAPGGGSEGGAPPSMLEDGNGAVLESRASEADSTAPGAGEGPSGHDDGDDPAAPALGEVDGGSARTGGPSPMDVPVDSGAGDGEQAASLAVSENISAEGGAGTPRQGDPNAREGEGTDGGGGEQSGAEGGGMTGAAAGGAEKPGSSGEGGGEKGAPSGAADASSPHVKFSPRSMGPEPPDPVPAPAPMVRAGSMGRSSSLADRNKKHDSWGVFTVDNPVRKTCKQILATGWFDNVVLLAICANCLFIIMEKESQGTSSECETGDMRCLYVISEVVFTVFYTVEFLVKTIANGFLFHHKAYLKDFWNQLDVLVLLASWMTLVLSLVSSGNSGAVSWAVPFRMMRLLRAIRTVQHVAGLRVLVMALLRAVPLLLRVVSLVLLIIVLFALLAIALFSGNLRHRCVFLPELEALSPDWGSLKRVELARLFEGKYGALWQDQEELGIDGPLHPLPRFCGSTSDCPSNYSCVELYNPFWRYLNFDHFGYSTLTIFQIITGEGWAEVMYFTWLTSSRWCGIYFTLVAIVGTNLLMNLLLAVIKESFTTSMTQNIKSQQGQKLWALKLATSSIVHNPRSPFGLMRSFSRGDLSRMVQAPFRGISNLLSSSVWWMACRRRCKTLADTPWFQHIMMVFTFVNVILMSVPHSGMRSALNNTLESIYVGFNFVFLFESIVKIVGYGRAFKRNRFDVFDFVVVVIGVADFSASSYSSNVSAFRAIRALRLLRVVRAFKVARYLDSLRAAGEVLIKSADVFGYMMLLLSLFIFTYAVIGMELFKDFYDSVSDDELLSPRSHFKSFFWSFITVYQALTLEGWTYLMFDAMKYSKVAGSAFYCSWVILGPYILLSLLMSVVLDNFERDYFEQRQKRKQAKGVHGAADVNSQHGIMGRLMHQMNAAIRRALDKQGNDSGAIMDLVEDDGYDDDPGFAGEDEYGWKIMADDLQPLLESLDVDCSDGLIGKLHSAMQRPGEDDQKGYRLKTFVEEAEEHLSAAAVMDLQAAFLCWSTYDSDGSGSVNVREIETVMLALGDFRDEAAIGELLQKLDMDGDGNVHFFEFLRAKHTGKPLFPGSSMYAMLGEEKIRNLKAVFSQYDVDGSGNINKEELGYVMAQVGQKMSGWELAQLMSQMDYDDSGQISFGEFIRTLGRIEQTQQAEMDARAAQEAGVDPEDSRDVKEQNLEGLISRGAAGSRWANAVAFSGTGAESDLGEDHVITQSNRTLQRIVSLEGEGGGEGASPRPEGNAAGAPEGPEGPTGIMGMLRGVANKVAPGAPPEDGSQGTTGGAADKPPPERTSGRPEPLMIPEDVPVHHGSDHGSGNPLSPTQALIKSGLSTPSKIARQLSSMMSLQIDDDDFVSMFNKEGKSAVLTGKSMGIFSNDSKLRSNLASVIANPVFEMVIMMLIVASCITLAFETPQVRESEGTSKDVLRYLDVCFTGVFFLEMMLKIIVRGVWWGELAYLRDGWNVLDMTIVLSSLTNILLELTVNSNTVKSLRVLRLVRALRPLRAVARGSSMRQLVTTLMNSGMAVFNVSVIIFFLVYIFGVLGIQLFAGSFYRCVSGGVYRECPPGSSFAPEDGAYCVPPPVSISADEPWYAKLAECEAAVGAGNCLYEQYVNMEAYASRDPCEANGFRWRDQILNFNNAGRTAVTLFVVSTGEGWVDIMHSSVDAGSRNVEPGKVFTMNIDTIPEENWAAAIYYVVFLSVVYFNMVNMFAGATYSYYVRQRDEDDSSNSYLTKSQREWVTMQSLLEKELGNLRQPQQLPAIKQRVADVIEGRTFKNTLSMFIMLHLLIQLTGHEDQSDLHSAIIVWSSVFMTFVVFMEIVLKCWVWSIGDFWRDNWNRFDLLVFCASVLDCSFWHITRTVVVMSPTARILRVGRFFRQASNQQDGLTSSLFRNIKKLQLILETFLSTLKSLLNVGMVLLIFYFMFAILGMNLFGDLGDQGLHLNKFANFKTLSYSLSTLFRISSGEDWQALYEDIVFFQCAEETRVLKPEECPIAGPFAYFMFYYIINVFVVMNLFVAIIIEIFASIVSREYSDLAMEHVTDWGDIWVRRCSYDRRGESYLSVEQFKEFLIDLPAPLGVGADGSESSVLARVKELRIMPIKGRVYFRPALHSSVLRVARMMNPATRWDNEKYLSAQFVGTSYLSVFLSSTESGSLQDRDGNIVGRSPRTGDHAHASSPPVPRPRPSTDDEKREKIERAAAERRGAGNQVSPTPPP